MATQMEEFYDWDDWDDDEWIEEAEEREREKAENCTCGAYAIINGKFVVLADCCCGA